MPISPTPADILASAASDGSVLDNVTLLRMPDFGNFSNASNHIQPALVWQHYPNPEYAQFIKEQKATAAEYQKAADEFRDMYKGVEIDVSEPDITPLERLWRLAIVTTQPNASDEKRWYVDVWAAWWSKLKVGLPFDTRSNGERLATYVKRRRSGNILDTEEILSFESAFHDLYQGGSKIEAELMEGIESHQ